MPSLPSLPHLELLRLHVAAVWYLPVPALVVGDVMLPGEGALPPWTLYLGELAEGRVRLWRPDVSEEARPDLLRRAEAALGLPTSAPAEEGVVREVALALAATPRIDANTAGQIARPLT